MSLFNWFSWKSNPGHRRPASGASGNTQPPSAVSADEARSSRGGPASRRLGPPGVRRSERSERRERLYTVVRDAMVRAGVLSASYKFKVLSLDSAGQRFVVMMDLARSHTSETARLSEIEAWIAETAKARLSAAVTAVYWRISDQVGAMPGAMAVATPQAAVLSTTALPTARRGQQATSFEPIDELEMAAFKQALAATQGGGAKSSATKNVSPGRLQRASPVLSPRPPEPDSRAYSGDTAPADLGATQYGELR